MNKIDLSSGWVFQDPRNKKWYPAEVPGSVHRDLMRAGRIPDPYWGRNERELEWIENSDFTYCCTFEVEASLLQEEHVELVFEGLDTIADIRLNGRSVGHSENMFVWWRKGVKELLCPGSNKLEVRFRNPMAYIREKSPDPLVPMCNDPVGGRQYIRKEQCSFGWDWGPRLPTCGIWQPVRLEAWSGNRLSDWHWVQQHKRGKVRILVRTEAVKRRKSTRCRASIRFGEKLVDSVEFSPGSEAVLEVLKPHLWWCKGLGDQPLYDIVIETLEEGVVVDRDSRRIGLCEIRLDQSPDQWGKSFQFVVNGRPIFAKGANWIPAHSFPNEGERYFTDLLDSAVEAHMNMIRVWGGGVYEPDSFYEACLERGLLVWQDFMFACSTYPADRAFLSSVKAEAECQVRRLRKFSNLALWCGNNEIEQMLNGSLFREDRKAKDDYYRLFYKLLPEVLGRLNPEVSYWPSSCHNPDQWDGEPRNPESGDIHFWGVWHALQPVEAFEALQHRFFSEFGMQAYPHVETAATFTKSRNLFGPEMDNHQKNGAGNQIIMHYVASNYRFPKDYRAAVYLSQINQAFCMRFGIEHMRRNMPRTMGALYWQLNDCWPVASWSGIDFGGKWKALHHAARRFFAPVLVSVKRLGSEELHKSSNRLFSTIDAMEINTVYDGPAPVDGELSWELWSVSRNAVLRRGRKRVAMRPNRVLQPEVVRAAGEIRSQGREDLVLRTRLLASGFPVNENTTFFCPVRQVEFGIPAFSWQVGPGSSGLEYEVEMSSDRIAYQIYVNLEGAVSFRVSDNFFDLFPGEKKWLRFTLEKPMSLTAFRKSLSVYSYVDSYEV